MFTYRTKLVAGFAALFLVLLIANTVDHFYISKLYRPLNEIEEACQKRHYTSNLLLTLKDVLTSHNDYLITGNPVEKENIMNLMEQIDNMLKIIAKTTLKYEEQALLKIAQPKFEEIKHLAEEIFAIENPIGNKTGSELMKRMDTSAYVLKKYLERTNEIHHEKTISAINNTKSLYKLESKIYWISVLFSVVFATVIGLFIYHAGNELQRRTKQIESAKQEWERTFDAVKDFVTIHDKDFNIIRVNKATAERFNTTPEALIGKKCYEVFHCTSEPTSMCPHKKTIETGEPSVAELDDPYLGGIFYTLSYPLINESGEVYGSVHIMRDVTEQKKADQKVKDEAEINKAVLTVAKFISSTMDVETITQNVVQITPSLVKCDRCVMLLWDDKQNVLLPMAYHGLEANLVPVFKALRIKPGEIKAVDEIKKQKTTMVIEDPINSPLLPSELVNTFKIGPNIMTPIISRGEVMGMLIIDYIKEHCTLGPRQIAIVEGIAAQTGIALENARLYRESMDRMMELEHHVQTIQALHDIDISILSTVNRDEILETSVQMIRRIIPCDRITVVTVDKEAKCFKYVAGFGIEFPKGLIVPFEDTNATEVLRTGRPISRPNFFFEKNLLPLDRKFMEQGFRSDIRIPIKVKEEIVALLNIGSYRIAAYTPEHLSTAEKLATQFGVALEHARLFQDLQDLLINTVKTLATTIDAKSPWTRGHSERVTKLAINIGRKMELTQKEIDDLQFAGLLHDIGKIGTSEHIIDKPGKLTDEEFAIVKEHPSKGAEIIKPIKQFENVIQGVLQHHERIDGMGYPNGLKNGGIHILGKILALADAYDAMTSERPYRKGLGWDKTIAEIKRCAGTQFDPTVVDAFLSTMEKGLPA
ncbi:MAG TPA: HD domain-containing phosphohydrolase [Candidatus Brocadiia bacterium]|nr:HD domain-containing protein [Candidatus Brocadiales bacterium]